MAARSRQNWRFRVVDACCLTLMLFHERCVTSFPSTFSNLVWVLNSWKSLIYPSEHPTIRESGSIGFH